MPVLATRRLEISALPAAHLRLSLSDPEQLAAALNCTLAEGCFSDASRRAIYVKLEKMELAGETLHPWYTYWLIVLRDEKVALGLVGFKGFPDDQGEVEIGYGISPLYQGRGYMTEAVQRLVAWAFLQPGCGSVCAETLRTNLASHRVLQKSGFQVFRETQQEIYWRIRRGAVDQKPAGGSQPKAERRGGDR